MSTSAPTVVDWQDLVAIKKAHQTHSIPKDWLIPQSDLPPTDQLDVTAIPESCGILSPTEIEITNTHVDPLLAKLKEGAWSAVQVTTAFAKRAVIAHQLTNCLTEIFIDRALERAAELDAHFKNTGTVLGPLHGLPISLKDQINVEGIESTMGYVSWIGKHATKNSVLVDILLSAGAVLYVKTNTPQTLMWPETFNLIFGRTLNPFNRSLTSGGSSGGEGALVAMKGSPLGVGSDIGGSIRIPAAFNGLYALRPSSNRVPYAGCVNSLEGQDSIPSVLGPLSASFGGVKAFMKAVAAGEPWLKDALVVRKRWSEEEGEGLIEHGKRKGKLCFAVLWDDEVVRPHPPVLRGLEETKKALEDSGHTVIDWKPLRHKEIYEAIREIWNAGAQEDYQTTTSPTGEPIISSMSPLVTFPVDPSSMPVPPPAFRPPPTGISAYALWQVQKRKRDLRQEYTELWQNTVQRTGTGRPVDAIISPCAPYVAPPHGENKHVNYTMIWNGLDYPATIIPVSKVDPVLDAQRPRDEFYNDIDKAHYEFYDPERFKNAPITVQIVARTLEEEAVLAMSEIVDQALKKRAGAGVQKL